MKELFGIPMSTFATILVVLLVICLLIVVYIALRKPIVFKMGLRGIPRRPAQTVLIVIGLMLSTLIVTSALGVGDTLDSSVRGFAYDQLGEIDQIIVTSDRGEADTFTGNYFPETQFADVQSRLAGMPDIDGLLPTIYSSVATINNQTQLANSQVFVTGLDPAYLGPFGGIKSVNGDQIDLNSFPQGTVVVSQALSEDLNLKVGDTFTAYVSGKPTDLAVGAIARNSALLGFGNNPDGTTNSSAFAMALPQAQALLNHQGELNSIFVTMTGGVEQPKERIEDVNAEAAKRLEGSGLGIYDGKADFLDAAEGISTGFTSIFIVLGLFSIAAGILLIVLIFTMLAAERRPEMGMARAVGQRRLQLIQQFIAEGSGYALAAGIVGAALGIAATFLLGAVLNSLLGDAFPIHATISATSLISAYALGVFITFVTVVAASWKVSRLNIVAAVRDIPDVQASRRRKRTLVWGSLLILLGAGLLLGGTSSDKAFPFYAGISLLPFGIALFARFFGVPSRLAFSLVGLWLVVVWLLPDSVFEKIFGKYDGGIEMFFLSGIFLVIGSTVLIVQNTTTLLRGVTALGGLFKSRLAAVKLAVAYPGQARGRTGMAIAMFSLIIFSLVMIATISQNLTAAFLNEDALAGWDIQADTNIGQPVNDFQGKVAAAPIDQSEITAIGKVTRNNSGLVPMQEIGPTQGPQGSFTLYEMDPAFLDTTKWKFSYRANGYDSDQAIVDAMKADSTLVV
ncbi:MAG TPA: ABC transporter permease, partial [Thermomicrobiales bacterium]|nr:ABC transporter permease [Thermomicrobiales bacterium]